ncbi:hypothetical protein GCM10028895_14400 [Pontibacter rugosus]
MPTAVLSQLVQVSDIAGPSGLKATTLASTCGNANGQVVLYSVNGGISPYTYSKDGVNYQTSATFSNLLAGNYTFSVKDANGCVYSEQVTVSNMAGPTFDVTAQASTCGNSNGRVNIGTVTGGTAPFTYSKDGTNFQTGTSFTGLAAGNYTITIKDANGCLATQAVAVTNIAGPSDVALEKTSSTCGSSNGSIKVSVVTGGTAPYTYAINGTTFQAGTTFSGLLANEYTISVKDANGCITSKKVVVTNIAGPSDLAASTKASTCGASNGELYLTGVTGGTAPYTYSKDGNTFQASATFTGLLAGSHSITVKDANGCTFAKSFTVADMAGPSAVLASSAPATCADNDGEITAGTVTGGTAPHTYSINGTIFQSSTTFSGLASGNYTLVAKDANGCTISTSVTVGKNVPTAFTSTTTSATCGSNNGQLSITGVTGGDAPYTYSQDGTTFQASATFQNLLPGTYTITVKDANGCTFAKQVQVNNIAGPTDLDASVTATTCGNSNGSLTVTGVTRGTAPYSYSLNGAPFQASASYAGLAAGAYQVRVKDANGCIYAEEVVISNVTGPAFTATTKSSTCGNSNGSILIGTVTGGIAPYTYSKDGTNFQSSTTFSALAAGAYTITAKDANGCTYTSYVTVENVAGPTDLILSSQPSSCNSNNGSISVSAVTGGTAPYTYAINGTTFQSGTSFAAVYAGEYTITVKDANGCIFAKQVVVGNINGPSSLTASSTSSTCGSANGKLEMTGVTGGVAPYTYSKNGTIFQASTVFEGLLAGTHTFTVKDANGCTFFKTFTVSDIAGPSAVVASSTPATCADNNGTITAGAVTGGTAPYAYSINGTAFQSGTMFNAVASGTYTLTVKDANGCTVSTSVRVSKNTPTSFTSTTTASTCGSSNGTLTITGVTGGTAPYTYSKDGLVFQTNNNFTALLAGAYTITVKDANGCTFAAQVQVSNVAGPTDLTANVKPTTCGGSNGELVVSGVTGDTAPYTYAINGGAFQTSNAFSQLTAGTYTVAVKDVKGCIYTEEVVVNDVAGPIFTVVPQASTCVNSNGSIVISNITSGTAPFTYSKDGINYQTGTSFNNLAAGNYTITVKDANGCLSTKAVAVVNVAGPSDLMLATTASTCSGYNGTLEITGVTGGTAPFAFSINGNNFQSEATFENLLAGEYTVTARDANGCITSKKVTVSDLAGPSALSAATKATTCGASNGELSLTVTGGTAPYIYSKDGVNFQAASSFTALAAGQHRITVKDANGCTLVKTFTLTNIAGPTAVASTTMPATCADNDGSITFGTVTGGTAPYTYSLDGSAFKADQLFAGLASGAYTITVKDANGCTFAKEVTVSKNIPTAFTSTTISSTCGDSNGSFTITGVTGGAAPYAYSIDGASFRSSAKFSALPAASYEVTVRDAKGCTYTGNVQISNIAGPDFSTTAKATTCGSNNGSISISNVTGGVAPYTYSKDGNIFQAATTFNGLIAGTYTIITKDANGCISSQQVQVHDIAGPDTFEFTTTTSTCGNSNGSINIGQVTGGTAPFTYAVDGGSYQAAVSFTGIAAGEHTVTAKDANGCTVTKKVTVTNIAGPSDLAAASTSSTCGASNGELDVTGITGGTAPFVFSVGGGAFQSSTTFAALAAGQHVVMVKDANGCTLTKSFSISNITGPSAIAATPLPATCADNDGSITAGVVTGGTAPYTYSLDGINFQASTNFGALASGTYTLTAKDANGCTVSTSVRVGKNIPTAFASITVASTCGSNDGQLSITRVTGGTAPYTYSINGSTFQTAAAFSTLSSGKYNITVKDANGCIFTDQVMVNDQGGPTDLIAIAKNTTCGNSNGSISIDQVTSGTTPYTYAIDGVNFQSSASFSALTAATYTVSVKDANGCLYTEEVEIIDVAAPTFTATAQASTCGNSNGSIVLSDISGTASPFQFSLDGVSFQSATTFNRLAAGNYTVTVKDANGCTREVKVVLENIAGPSDFSLASTASTCGDSNGSITVNNIKGGTAPFTYSLDGANFQGEANFATVLAGKHFVIIKDANGCTISKKITVADVAGPAGLTAAQTQTTCGASNGALDITGVSGGVMPYTYSIDGANFQTATSFTGLVAGNYSLYVKDAYECLFVKAFAVTDIAGPSAITAITQPATCADNDGSISVSDVTGGTTSYRYSLDGTNFQNSNIFTALASGTYTLTVKDANGCTFSRELVVEKNVPVAFTYSTDSSTCGDSNGRFTITSVRGGTAPYTYSMNGSPYQSSATFKALAAGVYQVTVKDVNGCTFIDKVQLNDVAGPAFTATAKASTCGNSNGSVSIAQVSGGTAPYTYSIDGTTFQAGTTFANLKASSYTIIAKDANGCSSTKAVDVTDVAGPSNLAMQTTASTCGNRTGEIVISAVTDGTAPYTFSINGTDFQSAMSFGRLSAGEYTITVKDANGCTFAKSTIVENINGPTGFIANSVSTICGSATGELSISGVTGGALPYAYSKDGTTFQASATFRGLLAGDHTITVKDANGCTFVKTFNIADIAGPSAVAVSSTPATCADNNGSISTGEVTGGTALIHTLSPELISRVALPSRVLLLATTPCR